MLGLHQRSVDRHKAAELEEENGAAGKQMTTATASDSWMQMEHIDKGNAEHLLANLDRLSDEKVDSLLTDLLADEKVSE